MYNFTNSPQNTPMDIKFIARERLSKSALLLAVISVFLSQTIVFSLILSGIALMQAILSVKGGERLKGKSLYAFLIACFFNSSDSVSDHFGNIYRHNSGYPFSRNQSSA